MSDAHRVQVAVYHDPWYPEPMLLSDRDIRAEIEDGRVQLDPYDPRMIQPASIDVTLGDTFKSFVNTENYIDPTNASYNAMLEEKVSSDGIFVLYPSYFVLGSTAEILTLPNDLAARIEGKSSLGRLGLLTHVTAGFIDPGFSGQLTLELHNVSPMPILLRPGMKIGQLCFFHMSSASERPYGSEGLGSHYQGQMGPTQAR
jgi:dCTP deaminase